MQVRSSDLNPTNTIQQRWWNATSTITLQKIIIYILLEVLLYYLLNLHTFMKQAVMLKRPRWKGTEVDFQPTAFCKAMNIANNHSVSLEAITSPLELSSEIIASWSTPSLQPHETLKENDLPKMWQNSWPTVMVQ